MPPLSITSLSLAAVLATAALAPCRAETIDPGFLDRMAEERNAAKVPGRPIVLPPAPRQVVTQPRHLLVCMSVPAWSPILAAPRADAPVIGRTTSAVAASMNTVAGYAEIVPFTSHSVGYISKALLSPFRSTVKPGTTCTIVFGPRDQVLYQYQ